MSIEASKVTQTTTILFLLILSFRLFIDRKKNYKYFNFYPEAGVILFRRHTSCMHVANSLPSILTQL